MYLEVRSEHESAWICMILAEVMIMIMVRQLYQVKMVMDHNKEGWHKFTGGWSVFMEGKVRI